MPQPLDYESPDTRTAGRGRRRIAICLEISKWCCFLSAMFFIATSPMGRITPTLLLLRGANAMSSLLCIMTGLIALPGAAPEERWIVLGLSLLSLLLGTLAVLTPQLIR